MVNSFFDNVSSYNEQNLIEDLIIESIQQNGMDLYYIPRNFVALNPVFGEDTLSSFTSYYTIEGFLENFDGFMGDKAMLSSFGFESRKEITFSISKRRFHEEVSVKGAYNTPIPGPALTGKQVRPPQQGDLIYLPLTRDLFQITFVDPEAIFYQLGKTYTYKLSLEKWMYSNETVATGIQDVDSIVAQLKNIDAIPVIEPSDNASLKTSGDAAMDFSEADPFSEGNYS